MKKPAAILVPVVIGIFAFWWFHPKNVLKRRVVDFFETAEVPESMGDLARSSRGPNVAKFLDQRFEVMAPENFDQRVGDSYSRDNAAALYSGVARFCRQITFLKPEFTAIEIPADDQAHVSLSIDTIVELPNRRPVDGILKVETTWRKTDSDWLLSRIAWEETSR